MKNAYDNSQAELANVKWELEKLQEMIKNRKELTPEIKELLSTPIYHLELSSRIKNICKAYDLDTLTDLVRLRRKDFIGARNLGKKGIDEVEIFLAKHGLCWHMNI